MPPSMLPHLLKTGDGQNHRLPWSRVCTLTAALCQKYLGKRRMTDQQQSPSALRGLARQATEDRIRAERTLEVLRRKEQDLCKRRLLAEAALVE